MKEQSVRVIKFNFEHLKKRVFKGCKYTPFNEKGIKETRNKPMLVLNSMLIMY